jgi:putative transcriptional regulator
MSNENMIRARRGPDGRLEQILPDGSTRLLEGMTEADWARFDAMTEEEIIQNALEDPDNPPRTTAELARMRRIPNPRKLRLSMHLSQEEFARQFQIALPTIRDWEEGIRMPDGTAITYLRLIEKIPDTIRQALGGSRESEVGSRK